ncbi:MAG: hypothetical protein AABY84_08905 [Candidatus Firestonebacteria bacterium]
MNYIKSGIVVLVTLLVLSIVMPCNAEEYSSEPGMEYGGAFGALSVDGKMYYMFAFRPEITFWKFGLGLEFRLLWNDDGMRENDYTLPNIFRYIRYGHKNEAPVYAKLGVLDSAILGHGFLMRNYSNQSITAFDRIWGTEFDVYLGAAGIETVTNDIRNTRLIGGRAYYKPLESSGLFLIDGLTIGGTYIIDRDPAKGKIVTKPYSELIVYGADIGLPIIETEPFTCTLYADYGKIKEQGDGYAAPGFMGKLLILDYRFEYRNNARNFIPGLFDYIYENIRPIDWSLSRYDASLPRRKGTYGEIGASIMNMVYLLATHEKYDGENSNILGQATLKANFIPKITDVSLTYYQKDVELFKGITSKSENTVIKARVGFLLSGGVTLYAVVKQTYDPVLEKFKRTTTMEVAFRF